MQHRASHIKQRISLMWGLLAAGLAVVLVGMMASSPAQAHGDPNTEADLNNDRVIVWCNNSSQGGIPAQTTVKEAFALWNTGLTNAGLTSYVKFVQKSQTTLPCELRGQMTDDPYAVAWIAQYTTPNLILYNRTHWNNQTTTDRRITITHEIGHTLDLGHVPSPEYCYAPYSSVMANWCGYYGAPVPTKPGPHDLDDVRLRWGPGGYLPNNRYP
jgi:hypothetical protein